MSIDKSKSENKIVINQYRSLMRIVNSDINLNEKKNDTFCFQSCYQSP